MERLPVSLSPTDTLKRLAREKQAELARCDDPQRRIVLLQERNALLTGLRATALNDLPQPPDATAPPEARSQRKRDQA